MGRTAGLVSNAPRMGTSEGAGSFFLFFSQAEESKEFARDARRCLDAFFVTFRDFWSHCVKHLVNLYHNNVIAKF